MKKRNHLQPISHLTVTGDLTLQTYNAQHYALGKNRGVLGLFGFAARMKTILHAAAEDDPYADWFLLKVHDALGQARFQLQRLEKQYEEALAAKKNMPRKIIATHKPVTIPLQFVSPYGFMAADMLGDYDRVYSLILTAKFSGVLLDKPYDVIDLTLKRIINPALNLPLQWKAIGVTRQDVKNNTEKAQRAKELMGSPPLKVLNAQARAPYAPLLPLTKSTS